MGNTCCKEDHLDDDEYRYPCKKINFKDMYLISIYENQELKQEPAKQEIQQNQQEIQPAKQEIQQNQPEIHISNNKVDNDYETNSDDSYEILSNEHFENEL